VRVKVGPASESTRYLGLRSSPPDHNNATMTPYRLQIRGDITVRVNENGSDLVIDLPYADNDIWGFETVDDGSGGTDVVVTQNGAVVATFVTAPVFPLYVDVEMPFGGAHFREGRILSSNPDDNIIPGVDMKPDTGHDEDDEFNKSFLDPKWNIGSNVAVTLDYNGLAKSTVIAKFVDDTGAYWIYQDFAPASADFSITLCGHIAPVANYESIEIGVANTAETAYKKLAFGYDGGNGGIVVKMYDNTTVRATQVLGIQIDKLYLHIQRVAGAWSYHYSYNGIAWRKLTSDANAITVEHISAVMARYGAFGKAQMGIEWFRRDWLFL
jgi:hypothetical protein